MKVLRGVKSIACSAARPAVGAVSTVMAAMLLASCSAKLAPSPGTKASEAPPAAAEAPVASAAASKGQEPPVKEAAPRSHALSSQGYRKDVAKQIYQANGKHWFAGAPPPLLKAVIVLRMRVDAKGNLTSITVLRSNGFKALEALAMQSVRNAAPLPAPNRLALRGGSVEFLETWLFRNDGRFQIHTLADLQATES